MNGSNPNDIRKALLQAVENQLAENAPPKTRETLERLIAQRISREEALRLIACVLSNELSDLFNNRDEFNAERYDKGLGDLLKLPWDD